MTAGTPPVRVRAYLHQGRLKAEWVGRLARHERCWAVGATWTRDPVDVAAFTFEPGDRLVEVFWRDRWLNIIRVAAPGGMLKGYYINLATPARLDPPRDAPGGCWALQYVDLILDAVVDPTGRWWWLDRAAFREFLAPPPGSRAARPPGLPEQAVAAGAPATVSRRDGEPGPDADLRAGARRAAGQLARALAAGALTFVETLAPWDELVTVLGLPRRVSG
ncbi:MAG TPA: DUF402 domain-containing protein [Thermaerobacter sp.]